MEEFLDSCIQNYKDLAGPGTIVKSYNTPFFADDHRESPAGAPGCGRVQECPWCLHTFPPTHIWDNVDELETFIAKRKVDGPGPPQGGHPSGGGPPGAAQPDHHADRGRLQPIASRVLMKILWAARLARFDLLRAVGHLATKVTKWTSKQDKELHRLIGYIQKTKHWRMIGWVGDPLRDVQPHLFADADFAGCVRSQRCTSGLHLVVRGPSTSSPSPARANARGVRAIQHLRRRWWRRIGRCELSEFLV